MAGVLEGRVAIVTGAGRGVGAGIARAFAKEGARVAVVDIDTDGAERVATELTSYAEAASYHCDIRDSAQVDACVAAVAERFGTVDVLVNNAIDATSGKFEETTDEDLDRVLDTGPKATLYFMRACFPHLRDSDAGRVINLRSGSEPQGMAGFGAYVASKAAVGGLTRVAAREWGRHGITVNNLAPFVLSDGARSYFDERPEELEKIVLKSLAIPRLGEAESDVGRAAVFLAGPDSSYVTGVTLSVDGGGSFFS